MENLNQIKNKVIEDNFTMEDYIQAEQIDFRTQTDLSKNKLMDVTEQTPGGQPIDYTTH
jgi:hypothetical protein